MMNKEDKADVKRSMGKALAKKIGKVTDDKSSLHVAHKALKKRC